MGRTEDRADGAPSANDRRAATAIAGHTGDRGRVRSSLTDPDANVRGAAYRALAVLGPIDPSDLVAAIGDPSPIVRRAICELAGERCPGPYGALLDDGEPAVVEAACFAVGETREPGVVPRLAEIATSHPDPLCREAAVAAIGAIGDPRGKPAVLGALSDTSYIRRRAVVALAAFTGDDVDAALRERREDRDWQVRQAAEDVIGINRPTAS